MLVSIAVTCMLELFILHHDMMNRLKTRNPSFVNLILTRCVCFGNEFTRKWARVRVGLYCQNDFKATSRYKTSRINEKVDNVSSFTFSYILYEIIFRRNRCTEYCIDFLTIVATDLSSGCFCRICTKN